MPAQCCIDRLKRLFEEDPDMPIFCVFGKDLLALETVDFWIMKAREKGVNQGKIQRVIEHRDAIARFYAEHPERCKIPD